MHQHFKEYLQKITNADYLKKKRSRNGFKKTNQTLLDDKELKCELVEGRVKLPTNNIFLNNAENLYLLSFFFISRSTTFLL